MSETALNQPQITAALEQQVWKLRTRCWSEFDIADKFGLTQEAVHHILNSVGQRLHKLFSQQIERMRAEQTDQLLHIAHVALDAWQQTQPDEPVAPSYQTPEPSPLSEPTPASLSPEPAASSPEQLRRPVPAFLKIALKAYADLRALWGLDATKKTDVRPKIPAVKALIGVDIERLKEGIDKLDINVEENPSVI